MKDHLLQRILLPKPNLKSEVFAGIGVLSGLKEEFKSLLSNILRFDYMGSSEFEFGTISKSLKEIYLSFEHYGLMEKTVKKRTIKGVDFFIITSMFTVDKYTQLIESWSDKNYYQEYHGLKDTIKNKTKDNIQGWLDINDYVLFFINEEMANQVGKLLRPSTFEKEE